MGGILRHYSAGFDKQVPFSTYNNAPIDLANKVRCWVTAAIAWSETNDDKVRIADIQISHNPNYRS